VFIDQMRRVEFWSEHELNLICQQVEDCERQTRNDTSDSLCLISLVETATRQV
jgi:hypothetical protein